MKIDTGFTHLQKFSDALKQLHDGKGVVFGEVCNFAKAVLISELQKQINAPVFIITCGAKEQERLFQDIELINPYSTYIYPSWDVLPQEGNPPHKDISGARMRVLDRMLNQPDMRKDIVLAEIGTFLQKAIDPKMFRESIIHLEKGDSFDFSDLTREIFHRGYKRVDRVEEIGEFSVRGGIIDVFSLSDSLPYRIEFWGNAVDTIRIFDPKTQLSERQADKVKIFPSEEYDFYKRGQLVTIFDFFPPDAVVLIDEPDIVSKKMGQLRELIVSHGGMFLGEQQFCEKLAGFKRGVVSSELHSSEPFFSSQHQLILGTSAPSFLLHAVDEGLTSAQKIDERLKDINELVEDGYAIHLVFNNKGEKQRFFEICMDKGFDRLANLESHIGQISGGFVFPENQIAVISDQEIFGRYRTRPAHGKSKYKSTAPLREVIELYVGDLVVHTNYGIGKYQGVQKIRQDGEERQVIVLEYANKAVLYVPLIHSNLVQRYIGCGHDKPPQLDVLGTSSWMRKRKSVEEAVFDLAAEYLEIQAARKTMEGFRFGKDNAWMREFEASFIYEETEDQLKAIDSIKADMESARPMDRLICGDVGYGKTEVAIRAAFKAVMEGKQVAVLVPTTILAQQHHKVFSERMADYPVNVEMLSRFRTQSEQKQILDAASKGSVDILIGTHRLIQSDVRFKDLGLVVVDEEQRFGVRHKEQFKRLRRMVDMLTLTATPIPRTLYLALVGARDMSTINTPPENRLPVDTFVATFDEKCIKQAISREMNREGQVFFVHNRIKTIHKIKDKIQEFFPSARIAIGHGQMPERELAAVMDAFRAGNVDILVCTTIIESGLDIPNANTIIIDRADLFGLADLYQLRGRVGRYKNRAYAYLLVPPYKIPNEQAQRRLDAIETYQKLGAGFQIAMRDLEIRGAGNILGEKQHGHIAAVGFDLYCKLLKNAISHIKGEPVPQAPKVVLRLGFEAEIPSDYIPSESQRMAIYSRLQDIFLLEQTDELEKELDDIYGTLPLEVRLLLDCVRIKILAAEKKIDYIELKESKLLMKSGEYFVTEDGLKYYRVTQKDKIKITEQIKTILQQFVSCDTISPRN
ncbi:MAG: transcription-repair coupling factor [Candidatus Auribacterota bacterium]|jgi:transcription-repair coupling factor (superfamily II helicase)|nr:transcription-repair coupling factor [Candidatus Auribacterota bacterium]